MFIHNSRNLMIQSGQEQVEMRRRKKVEVRMGERNKKRKVSGGGRVE